MIQAALYGEAQLVALLGEVCRERERERETVREIREREEKEREIPTSTEVNSTILCGCLPMGFETKQQAEPSG